MVKVFKNQVFVNEVLVYQGENVEEFIRGLK